MVAVLEHLVRGAGVHLDEGLEKEFIVVLFVSSVCKGGEGMDDDNVSLFESLHELLDICDGVGVTIGRGGDVLSDSLVVNKYATIRQPFGREAHEVGKSACEFLRHASKGSFDPRVLGVVALRWHGGVPAVNDRDTKSAVIRGRGLPIGAVLTDRAMRTGRGRNFAGGYAARRVVLIRSPTRRLWGGFRFGGLNGLSGDGLRWVSEAAPGPRLNARSGGYAKGSVESTHKVPTSHYHIYCRNDPARGGSLTLSS